MGQSLDDVSPDGKFSRSYFPQRSGKDLATVTTGIPPDVIQAAADREGVSKEELIENYRVVHYYDDSGRSLMDWVEKNE